jgi:aspartate aminotransferase
MVQLSDRINQMEESATIAMSKKAREMKDNGIDVISLSLGEPDFNTPDFIKEAAKEGIDQNYTKYMPVPGYLDLREAISHKFKRDNNLSYAPKQIVVSQGAKESIANVVLALVNPGDEVIIPAPYWVSYIEIVRLAGGVPVIVETDIEDDFKLDAKGLSNAITDKSKLMIFSNPCNPTGSSYDKTELKEIADVIAQYPNLYVISDEIYEHINFESKQESLAQFENVYDQTITINGVSKSFAMTGWSLGFIVAPFEIANACTKMQGQFTSGTSSISQRAAIAAMNPEPKVIKNMIDKFKSRIELVYGLLNEIDGLITNMPGGAFYFFPDVTAFFGKSNGDIKVNNASDLAMYLLEVGRVATVTGDAFGNPKCIRLSYAASEEELIEAMARIKQALENLK